MSPFDELAKYKAKAYKYDNSAKGLQKFKKKYLIYSFIRVLPIILIIFFVIILKIL